MSKPVETETAFRRREGANFNTLVMSVGGSLIVGLMLVIGYFCKASLEGINTKLDKNADSQGTIQLQVNTLANQLPALAARVDKVETTQHDMWQRFGNQPSGTRPTGDK